MQQLREACLQQPSNNLHRSVLMALPCLLEQM
uniref:Uncharacterized protein n=1 Tax=virus sp. ctx9V1 TaxID=2828001 RepID=A0A8S5RDS9_9VIRU|nr:MAG TPA: hypothetical protein [virus sp. ctx9V1]